MLDVAFGGDASAFSSQLALSENSGVWQGQIVNCLDYLHQSRDVSDLLYQQKLGLVSAPHTKGAQESYVPSAACLGWPYPRQNPPHYASASNDAPPILMVNSFYDPETPLSQEINIQEQICAAFAQWRWSLEFHQR